MAAILSNSSIGHKTPLFEKCVNVKMLNQMCDWCPELVYIVHGQFFLLTSMHPSPLDGTPPDQADLCQTFHTYKMQCEFKMETIQIHSFWQATFLFSHLVIAQYERAFSVENYENKLLKSWQKIPWNRLLFKCSWGGCMRNEGRQTQILKNVEMIARCDKENCE